MPENRRLFIKEGDYWTLAYEGPAIRVRDSRGLRYIAQLLRSPGAEIHAGDLVAGVDAPGRSSKSAAADGLAVQASSDAGEVIDDAARDAYRRRIADLRAEQEEAERFNDPERAARASEEVDALSRELASAFGLGGRKRKAGSTSERARVNVRNAITSAIKAIAKHDKELAEHLRTTIRTGLLCSYAGGSRWTTEAGAPPASSSAMPTERFLATVLFTDVVGSTEQAAALGDARWREVLDQHDALTVAAIERCDGRVVKSFGDSFFATFEAPAKAIRCAGAISKALHPLGIEVRAGIHTGECEPRGDDVGGLAVHIGARILALAGPSEVLVSSTVRDLVTGSGLRFDDRGFHELRGVPGSWRLFALASAKSSARSERAPRQGFSIMLVDDHPMWRESLRKVVEHACTATVVAEASDGEEAIEMARAARPDVIVMDLNLPKMNGPDATRGILAELPQTRVLVLSSSDEKDDVLDAIRAGASGYLVKTAGSAQVAEAVRRVRNGELVVPPDLTDVVLEGLRAGS